MTPAVIPRCNAAHQPHHAIPQRETMRWRAGPRMLVMLPIIACLAIAWVIAAGVAGIWMGIALLGRPALLQPDGHAGRRR